MSDYVSTAALLFVASLPYFRATATSERDARALAESGGETSALSRVLEADPVALLDPRVVASALLVAAPWFVLAFLPVGNGADFAAILSVTTFLGNLLVPSRVGPREGDSRSPLRFTLRWALRKADVAAKTAVAGAVGWLLSMIPGVSRVAAAVVSVALPIVPDSRPSAVALLLAGKETILLLMILLRCAMLGPRISLQLQFVVSTACCWISVQWLLNQPGQADAPAFALAGAALSTALLASYVKAFALDSVGARRR